jgi:hypothetical protein
MKYVRLIIWELTELKKVFNDEAFRLDGSAQKIQWNKSNNNADPLKCVNCSERGVLYRCVRFIGLIAIIIP